MKPIKEKQLKHLKEKLLEEKKAAEQHLERGEELRTQLSDTTGELSSYDNHPADLATETFERNRDMAVDEAFSTRVLEIEQALERMENGTYGACVVCGKDIPIERLEAIPSTPTCMEDSLDAADPTLRPVEEQVMTPPPSGAGEGRQHQAGHFDEADAWKLVESHGNSDSPAMAASREVKSYEQLSTNKAND